MTCHSEQPQEKVTGEVADVLSSFREAKLSISRSKAGVGGRRRHSLEGFQHNMSQWLPFHLSSLTSHLTRHRPILSLVLGEKETHTQMWCLKKGMTSHTGVRVSKSGHQRIGVKPWPFFQQNQLKRPLQSFHPKVNPVIQCVCVCVCVHVHAHTSPLQHAGFRKSVGGRTEVPIAFGDCVSHFYPSVLSFIKNQGKTPRDKQNTAKGIWAAPHGLSVLDAGMTLVSCILQRGRLDLGSS